MGDFTVQNKPEALYLLAAIYFFRTSTKMFFGNGQYLGNPPPICVLNGYGDFVYNNVSCIIKNFSVNMPNDVDYIEAGSNNGGLGGSSVSYVPTSSDITVSVQPVYSRTEVKTFDLMAFASGQMLLTKDGRGWV